MRVDISKGGAASELLHSPEFRAQWERLYADCPWASVFQSFAYASTWYEVYQSRFTPLLVDAYDQWGQLSGLFPLAVDANGSLVAAGGRQAEYQVWLARPGEGDAFIEAAVERLTAEFPGRTLTLRYVPPNAPLQWLRNRDIARRCGMRSVRRGLMDLREVDAEAALRKKNNRIKLNRLQRVGPVEYERLTEPEAIDALLEQIVP